tara:strand:- start:452 stop:823 length:372 start_codon:yes stop_codon:yes gene_type:complete
MTTYYHGAHTKFTTHEGQCFTTDFDVALKFAGMSGVVAKVEIGNALTITDCDGYDHDTNDCAADNEAFRAKMALSGSDVLRYDDEDDCGNELECFRIVSVAAMNGVVVVAVLNRDDAEDAWGY